MPKFEVRLTKNVQDVLDCYITVDAPTEALAAEKALVEAEGAVDWSVCHEGEGDAPQVDSMKLLTPADPVEALERLLADAEANHAGPTSHGMAIENPEHPWHESIMMARAALAAARAAKRAAGEG